MNTARIRGTDERSLLSIMVRRVVFVGALGVFLIAGPNHVMGAEYYVDGNTGADASNGLSWAAAKKSIGGANALLVASGSNTVYVRGDYTYREYIDVPQSGLSETQRLTYQGMPGVTGGAQPVITAGKALNTADFAITSGYANVYWIAETSRVYHVWVSVLGTNAWTAYSKQSDIASVSNTPASWFWVAAPTNVLYLRTSNDSHPTNFLMEAVTNGKAFFANSRNYLSVAGFSFRFGAYGANETYSSLVQQYGNYWRIYNNTFYWHHYAAWFGNNGNNGAYYNNTIGYCNLQAVQLSDTTNISFHNNTIHSFGTYGIYYLTLNNADVYNNLVAYGIYGIMGRLGGDLRIYNNTFYHAGEAGQSISIGDYQNPAIAFSNGTVFNNLVYITNTAYQGNCIYVSDAAHTGFRSDYNDFCSLSGSNIGYWSGSRLNLADWQAASGQDSNSLSANPSFVSTNAATLDLHLTRFSPCINRGVNAFNGINVPATDKDGRPRRQGLPDMGCYEYIFKGTIITAR